ncbi:MAG: molecular chaperone TorD family protein [Candidatus Tectomicrobia bacterium]|uniref:Molecular chaperone TorD family protein n=1 Tax=Tectimicrobiota bacterium TaxID=2528274 RepID=A0A932M0E5_UNCTE|nr:molecular chaperone TorD family protein [Candidatus Tectomicrobia bacterium]
MSERRERAGILETLRDRYATYGFLSRIYREELTGPLLREMAGSASLQDAPAPDSEGLTMIQEFAGGLQRADLEEVEWDLAAEYAGLFLSGAHSVSPYESVYTSRVMQEARDEVLKIYMGEGLEVSQGCNEPEDHLAIELELMRRLCQKTIDSMEQDDLRTALRCLERQEQFLARHLQAWVPRFCADMEKAARSGFYKGIAKVTGEFLALDKETIRELIEAVKDGISSGAPPPPPLSHDRRFAPG